MRIIWDTGKAAANVRKHYVSFAEAVTATVLIEPLAVTHAFLHTWNHHNIYGIKTGAVDR